MTTDRQNVTKEVKENLSVKESHSVVVMTTDRQNVTKEVKENLSVVDPIVRQNVMKKESVVAVADTAAKKTLNLTARAQQAKSASTNTSPTQASAHAVKPTTSSSQALSQ